MTTPLSANARQEIAHLARIAMNTSYAPAQRAHAVLTAHQRWEGGGCLCGWNELGRSHARHQADELERAGLLASGEELP